MKCSLILLAQGRLRSDLPPRGGGSGAAAAPDFGVCAVVLAVQIIQFLQLAQHDRLQDYTDPKFVDVVTMVQWAMRLPFTALAAVILPNWLALRAVALARRFRTQTALQDHRCSVILSENDFVRGKNLSRNIRSGPVRNSDCWRPRRDFRSQI